MQEYGYLGIESNSHYSLITVVNYGSAAPNVMPLEQQKKKGKNIKRTAKEQPNNTNNNYKNEKNKKKKKNYKKEYLKNSNSLNFQNLNSEKDIEEDSQGTKQTYEYVVQLIGEELPDVDSIPNQLSFDDFKLFFNHYNIYDIIKKLKEMDRWKDIRKQKNVATILNTFLTNDKDVLPLLWEKQRVLVVEPQLIDNEEIEEYFNEVKDLATWQGSKHGVSIDDKRHFVKEYYKWVKTFKKYPRFKSLSDLTFEEAIELEREYMEFWGHDVYVADLYYSSYLNKHTSTFEFLKDHFDLMYED